MNIVEMVRFIRFMTNEFMREYNRVVTRGKYQEDEGILEDGFCFYFAHLLNALIPNSQIVLIHQPFDHYLLCYDNQFYDYKGIKGKTEEGILIDEDIIPFKDLLFAVDPDYEWDLAEIYSIADKKKDAIYNSIMNELLEVGRTYLEEHHLLEPKMTL